MPTMGKTFHLRLDGFDLGQILDGLRCRQESWTNTAIYLRDEYFPNESFFCEECSDPDEAQKIADQKGEASASLPIAMTRVYLTQAMDKIEAAARKVIAAVADGDTLRTQLAILRRLAKHEPFNTIELRQQIAQRIIERGKYTLS